MARQFTFLILFCGLCAFNTFFQSKNASSPDANALCNWVSEIKQLPFKGLFERAKDQSAA
jgi:hypothetical protein